MALWATSSSLMNAGSDITRSSGRKGERVNTSGLAQYEVVERIAG